MAMKGRERRRGKSEKERVGREKTSILIVRELIKHELRLS